MEDEAAGRIFQFRINPALELEFLNLSAGPSPAKAVLPSTGVNAVEVNGWYHVAATYDSATNAFKYYWTRVDRTTPPTAADILLATTMTNPLAAGSGDFAVGNEDRSTNDNGFSGLIDEVRISGVARAANAFVFQTDAFVDGDADGLPDAWERQSFGNLEKTASDDDDADGQSTLAEYIAGTRQTDSVSVFKAKNPIYSAGSGFTLHWDSAVGRTYMILKSTNLTNIWSPVSSPFVGTGGELSFTDAQATGTKFFYKIQVSIP